MYLAEIADYQARGEKSRARIQRQGQTYNGHRLWTEPEDDVWRRHPRLDRRGHAARLDSERCAARPPPDHFDGDGQHAQATSRATKRVTSIEKPMPGMRLITAQPNSRKPAMTLTRRSQKRCPVSLATGVAVSVSSDVPLPAPASPNSNLAVARTTRTAMKASSKVSTVRRSKGGHSNARNEPMAARANVSKAATSDRIACPGSTVPLEPPGAKPAGPATRRRSRRQSILPGSGSPGRACPHSRPARGRQRR